MERRKGTKSKWLIGSMVALLLIGCNSTAPQRPSQRKGQAPEADSTQLAAMELNMQLAKAADKAVMEAVQAQEESYALYESKAWIHIYDNGDDQRDKPQLGQACDLHMRVYTFDEQLLLDTEGNYILGKSELPSAVERNACELNHGDKARMYVPWYTAFGQQGTAFVPPYENVIIDIEIR